MRCIIGWVLTLGMTVVWVASLPPESMVCAAGSGTPADSGETSALAVAVLHGRDAGKGSKGDVFCAAFSQDGKFLATGSNEGKLKIWNLDSAKFIGVLDTGSPYRVTSVVFMPGGKTLAAASADNTVRVWNLEDKSLSTTVVPKHAAEYGLQQVGMAVSPTTGVIATGGDDGVLHLFDRTTQEETLALKTDSGMIWDLVYSADGKTLATAEGSRKAGVASSAANAGQIVLRAPAKGAARLVIPSSSMVRALAFTPDNKLVAGAANDVTLYSAATGQPVVTVPHRYHARSVAISHNGNFGASGDLYTSTRVWNPVTGKVLMTFRPDGPVREVVMVAFSHDDKLLASVVKGDVYIWDVSNLGK